MNSRCPICGITIVDSGHVCCKEIPLVVSKYGDIVKLEKWDEVFEDNLLFQDDGLIELTSNCLNKLLEHFLSPIERPSYLKNCRKLKVKISGKPGVIKIERIK